MREGARGVWLSSMLLSGAAATLPAQQREAEAVIADLAAPAAITVAKAAAEARELPGREVSAALRRAVERWHDTAGVEASCVRALLLDALVLRDAKLPGDQLLPLLGDALAGDAAFVLLCRGGPTNESDLMTAFRQTPAEQGMRRRALGNLLVELRSPLFLDELLGAGLLQLRVVIKDRNEAIVRWGIGAPKVWPPAWPAGYPLAACYRLHLGSAASSPTPAAESGALIGVAPHVCAERDVAGYAADRQKNALTMEFSSDSARSLEEAWMLELSGVVLGPRELLVKDGAKSLARSLKIAGDEKAEARRQVLEGLRKRKLLTEERVRQLAAADLFVLVDERVDKTTPLPELPQR